MKVLSIIVLAFAVACSFTPKRSVDAVPSEMASAREKDSVSEKWWSRSTPDCEFSMPFRTCYEKNMDQVPLDSGRIAISLVVNKTLPVESIEVSSSIQHSEVLTKCLESELRKLDCVSTGDRNIKIVRRFDVHYSPEGRAIYVEYGHGNTGHQTLIDVDVGRFISLKSEFDSMRSDNIETREEWNKKFVREGVGPIACVLSEVKPTDDWFVPAIVEILHKEYEYFNDNNVRIAAESALFRNFPDAGLRECEKELHTKSFMHHSCAEQLVLHGVVSQSVLDDDSKKECAEVSSKRWGFMVTHQAGLDQEVYVKSISVVYLCEGGPAAKTGLRVRDRIVGVDGKDMPWVETMDYLRDPSKKEVELIVVRDGSRVKITMRHPGR